MDLPRHPVNAGRPAAARGRARTAAVLATLLPLLGAAPGCSLFEAPVVQRGHRVTADLLRDITPGVHTRQDVQALLGSPTTASTFGVENSYYISSKTRQRPGRQLLVTDRETVAVEFDGRGVVREVRVLTEADGQRIAMVDRETPTPGNERTLLQALFGNIGRIGPGATTQQAPNIGPGTGAPPPGQVR